MRGILRTVFILLFIVGCIGSTARAQIAGALHSARPLELGTTDVGGYFAFIDGAKGVGSLRAVFGQVRHGLIPGGDGGLKFGLVDVDNDVGLLMAADLQMAILAPRWDDPFWLSIGPEVTATSGTDINVWSFGGNLSCAYDIFVGPHSATRQRSNRQHWLSLYARLNLRLEIIDHNKAGKSSGTNLELGLNPGVIWEANEAFDVVAELQFDDWLGILVGINFRL